MTTAPPPPSVTAGRTSITCTPQGMLQLTMRRPNGELVSVPIAPQRLESWVLRTIKQELFT